MATTNNKVKYGLKNVHYAVATIGEEGDVTYDTPKALLGAQDMTASLLGGKTDVYADDIVFYTANGVSGQELTLTLTNLPESFLTDVLGYKKSSEGSLMEVVGAPVVSFALMFEISGDVSNRRVVYPLCVATPVVDSATTKGETVEINTVSLTVTARPALLDNESYIIRDILPPTDTRYNTLFTTAYTLPTSALE